MTELDEKVTKVIIPGVSLEGPKVKQPMVKRPVHLQKAHSSTLYRAVKDPAGQKIEQNTGDGAKNTSEVSPQKGKGNKPLDSSKGRQELTLKDLNPQDKKRVANLVRELAKVGEEREAALERLGKERSAFEERLQILQEEYEAVTKEKEYMQKRFVQLQSLLQKYSQQGISDKGGLISRKPIEATGAGTEHVQTPDQVNPPTPNLASPKRSLSFLEKIPGNKRPVSEVLSGSRQERLSAKQGLRSPSHSQRDIQKQEQGEVEQDSQQVNKQKQGQQKDSPRQQTRDKTLKADSTSVPRTVFGIQGAPNISPHESPAHGRDPGSDGAASSGQPQPGGGTATPRLATRVSYPSFGHNCYSSSTETHGPGTPQPQTLPRHCAIPVSSALPEQPVWGQLRNAPRDRSFSEASVVSQNFSAELDAVYRLYCREYELQLQLQQQQIELQRQQLQLQQQLQQMEFIQQQQLTRTLPLVAQPQTNHPLSSVVMETPTPSSAPNPAARPSAVSPTATLDPTPDVSEVFAANPSETEPSVPPVPGAPSRDGHAQQCPISQQQQRSAVGTVRRDPDETFQSRASTSYFVSPPLSRRNHREIRVPPHQDEALLTYALHSSQGDRQSLPLFESSLESLVPGPGRSIVGSARSPESQRQVKGNPAVQRPDRLTEGKENLVPTNSSQLGPMPRLPSSTSLHTSHERTAGSELQQRQVRASGGTGRAAPLPLGAAHAFGQGNSFHAHARDEDVSEGRKSSQLSGSGERFYSLHGDCDSKLECPDIGELPTSGRYIEQAQNTGCLYPRSIIDLVHSMENIPPETLEPEVKCSVENRPMLLRRSVSNERWKNERSGVISPERRDWSLRQTFGTVLDEDVEETRLLENIFFVSETH